jgi:hypothetical protein
MKLEGVQPVQQVRRVLVPVQDLYLAMAAKMQLK